MDTTILLWLLAVAVAFLAGLYAPRARCFASKVYWHTKLGICWRYLPTGYRETRNGTNSDFCRRCGHPAGYHN